MNSLFAPGGYAFGEMWNKLGQPIKKHAKFPLNTVTFKLLFTEATPKDIPFLEGSPTWKATIAKDPLHNKLVKGPSSERTPPVDMHFLQVDIAVRDSRADDTTGWVFGTFMYHNSVENENPWKRLMPVCLMWGNDPKLTEEKYNQGERPKESWINPKAAEALPKTRPYFGWLGRGNGPIDNFKSSCISCHSTASHPEQKSLYKEKYNTKYPVMDWFRNVKAGEKFRPNAKGVSLDYSLQMSAGFQNYKSWSEQWRPFPILPLYRDKHALDAGSPPGMLNARGIDISDYEDQEIKSREATPSDEEIKSK